MTDTPPLVFLLSNRASIRPGNAKHIWLMMYFMYNFSKCKNCLQKGGL
jgi:hypothetical protein